MDETEPAGMGLGGATRKLQKVADMGEELYEKMNELREQVMETRETVNNTNERVTALENKIDQQNALIEALAEKEGVDVDELLTKVAIEEAEPAVRDHDEAVSEAGADDEPIPDAESDAGTAGGE